MAVRVRIQSGIWVVVLWTLLLSGLRPATAQARSVPNASAVATRARTATNGPAGQGQEATLPATSSAVPLAFEPNRGQTDSRVAFLSHGPGYVLFLTPTQAVLNVVAPRHLDLDLRTAASAAPTPITGTVLRLSLVGANAQPTISGQDLLPGSANYLIGPASA